MLRDQMDNPASPVAQNRASNSQGLEVSEPSFSPKEDPTPSLSADPPREQPIIPREIALRKEEMKTKRSRNDVASDDPMHSDDGTGKRIVDKGDILTVLGVLVVGVLIPVLGLNIFLSSVGMRPYQLWPSPGSLAGITLNSQLDVFLIPFLVLLLIVVGVRWLNKH